MKCRLDLCTLARVPAADQTSMAPLIGVFELLQRLTGRVRGARMRLGRIG